VEEDIGHYEECREDFSDIAFKESQELVTEVVTIELNLAHEFFHRCAELKNSLFGFFAD